MRLFFFVLAYVFSFSLYAQINYDLLKGEWVKCSKATDPYGKDTLYMIPGHLPDSGCVNDYVGDVYISNTNTTYTFLNKDSVAVYNQSGGSLRKEFRKPIIDSTNYTLHYEIANGDTIAEYKIPNLIVYSSPGSACVFSFARYSLNRERNILTIGTKEDNQSIYQVIKLTENELVLLVIKDNYW